VFGSPVPGYRGSGETTDAAVRLHRVPFAVLADAAAAGALRLPPTAAVAPGVAITVGPMAARGGDLPPEVLAAGLSAWSQVLGQISLELFGHLHNAVGDAAVWFDHVAGQAAATAGLGLQR